jgi:hypothetical protein
MLSILLLIQNYQLENRSKFQREADFIEEFIELY